MKLDLVIDIGNTNLKAGFFSEGRLHDHFSIPVETIEHTLYQRLADKHIGAVLAASVNPRVEKTVFDLMESKKIPFHRLNFKDLRVVLEVEKPEEVGHDRIAHIYGALHFFPTNDCIVVDIGTAVTFDYITKAGHYLGGAIYPGIGISAQALASQIPHLPAVQIEKPLSALAKSTTTHIQSGIYYGLLGAVERIVAELQMEASSPSSVMVVATGGMTQLEDSLPDEHPKRQLIKDLQEITDAIHPQLNLIGLHEILKEILKKKEADGKPSL